MRINSVKIKNYRQYFDFNIDFERKGTKQLYALIARNGTGKSNFLNAITWCLYNKESHLSEKNKALPTLSLKKIRDMTIDETANIVVEMALTVESDEVVIRRTNSVRKNDDVQEPIFDLDNSLEVTVIGENNASYSNDDATRYINRILPNSLVEYFFFDNEQLDKYFSDNKGSSIKSSIYGISQISLLEKIEDRLENVLAEYIMKIGKQMPNVEYLNSLYEASRSSREDMEEDIGKLERQIKLSEDIIEECKQYLDGIGDIRELHKQQDELKSLRDAQIDELEQNKDNIYKFIVRYNTLIRMYPDLNKLDALITGMEDKGKLPPQVDIEFLRKMLKDNICLVCGKEELTDQERNHVMELIEEIQVPNRISHLLKGVSGHVTDLLDETIRYQDMKLKLFTKKKNIEKQIKYLESQIDDLQGQINKCADEKKAAERNGQKLKHQSLLDTNLRKLASYKTQLENLLKKEADAKLNRDTAIKKNEANKDLVITKERTEQFMSTVKEIKDELINEMKEKISTETFEIFDSMIWKTNTYKKVVIDNNYNVDLLNSDGYSAIGSCSAAERSLLALAFTLALHKVSGFDAPLVIDSPVGRVSDTNREEFGKVLIEVSKRKEVILLFTPSEYSEEIKPLFDKECTMITTIVTVDDESEAKLLGGVE